MRGKEEGTSRKQAILRAAQRLFARYGYARTTIRMVSQEAGVAFGLVAHHFGNKEKLFLAAGSALIDEVLATIRARTPHGISGREALAYLVGTYCAFTQEHPHIFPTLIRCSPFSDDNPTVDRGPIALKFQELIGAIEACVRRGMEDGSLDRSWDPRAAALLVYATVVGAVRTVFLAGFAKPDLFGQAQRFIDQALTSRGQ
jgi:AcrR family transcriptional regulator